MQRFMTLLRREIVSSSLQSSLCNCPLFLFVDTYSLDFAVSTDLQPIMASGQQPQQPAQQPQPAPVQQLQPPVHEEAKEHVSSVAKLVSSDGKTFHVPIKALGHCGMIGQMIGALGYNGDPIPLPDIDGETLKLVTQWMCVHVNDAHEYTAYTRSIDAYERRMEDMDLFDEENCTDLLRTKVLNAANYLDAPRLTDAVLGEVSVIVSNLTVKNIVRRLNLHIEQSEDELDTLRGQYAWFDL